jgi:hypothetical protein
LLAPQLKKAIETAYINKTKDEDDLGLKPKCTFCGTLISNPLISYTIGKKVYRKLQETTYKNTTMFKSAD